MTFPAMIFSAGFGTRMGALTEKMPKPMVPLAGRPMIDHAVDLLRDAGVSQIIANTHYLPDKIEPHLNDLEVEVIREDPDILDTGGGLRAALPRFSADTVITINPDAAWLGANPIKSLINAWRPEMQALLLLVPMTGAATTRTTGDFSLEQGKIHRNGEFLYTGAQIIRAHRMDRIKEKAFSLNLYWDLLAQDAPLNGVVYEGQWCDIGTPDGLAAADRLLGDV